MYYHGWKQSKPSSQNSREIILKNNKTLFCLAVLYHTQVFNFELSVPLILSYEQNVKYVVTQSVTCKQLVQDDCLLATISRER